MAPADVSVAGPVDEASVADVVSTPYPTKDRELHEILMMTPGVPDTHSTSQQHEPAEAASRRKSFGANRGRRASQFKQTASSLISEMAQSGHALSLERFIGYDGISNLLFLYDGAMV